MKDLIERQVIINELESWLKADGYSEGELNMLKAVLYELENMPSAQPERLTDDDFETIRIHLNAYKEKLCNQHRWKEAEKYQRIIDRFMAFAFAQPERKKGRWISLTNSSNNYICSECGHMLVGITDGKNTVAKNYPYCRCGAKMEGEQNEQ